MAWRPGEWLVPGTADAVPGMLEIDEGGLAFVKTPFARPLFAVSGSQLERVGPDSADRGLPEHVIAIEGAGGAVHRVRLEAEDCRWVVAVLVAERRHMGLPSIPVAVPVVDGDGVSGRRRPRPLEATAEDAPPSDAERAGLPMGSLPARWLAMTAGVEPRKARQLDGMSMLLELALRGCADAPTREALVVADRSTGHAALDGGRDRVAHRPDYATPGGTAHRLGAYVRALRTPESTAAAIAATRAAIEERHAGESRSALLVWLVKQDYVLHRIAFAILFPDNRRSDRRALRWSPDLHVDDDREATLRAHRVLAAIIIQPPATAGMG